MTEQLEFEWMNRYPPPSSTPKPASRPEKKSSPPVVKRDQEDDPQQEMKKMAEALLHWLMERTGKPIFLYITNNTSTMMSVKPHKNGKSTRISLHYMFLTAPEPVKEALVTWIKKPRSKDASVLLNRFIRERQHQIRAARSRRITRSTKGRHYDLQAIFNDLNQRYFNNTITDGITWGTMPWKRRRRSIRFGSHSLSQHLIRIHPLLDLPFVPDYFVRYIVYHEMLHAHLGIGEHPSGRRSIHPPRFKQMEKQFPEYERAIAWIKKPGTMNQLLKMQRR
ncbi:MAG TPA: hypothetical protein PLI09_25240 [Candidatus Hydrogenedentes bacterium]|nr:hypothetical protein [Candidatus Hydrogenedentota bacterium]